MNRQEAIERLRAECWRVTPGLRFEIGPMEPRDAWGVARCFYSVYGDRYPIDTYYVPERLLEENARGNVYTVVARASNGDVVAHGALYRSSSPHPRVFETGQLMVLPEYRTTSAAHRIFDWVLSETVQAAGPAAVFGEQVCHHVTTQKGLSRHGFSDCAIEIGLIPAAIYPREEFATDRVTTVLQFRVYQDCRRTVYVPERYRPQMEFLLAGIEMERTVAGCRESGPTVAASDVHREFFESSEVARANVRTAGEDFGSVADAFEADSQQRGARVLQVFLNLGDPAVEAAAEWLRGRGYFFGGFLPYWFASDGLLMQKVLDLPDFRSIKLYTERARRILEFIQGDMVTSGPRA